MPPQIISLLPLKVSFGNSTWLMPSFWHRFMLLVKDKCLGFGSFLNSPSFFTEIPFNDVSVISLLL